MILTANPSMTHAIFTAGVLLLGMAAARAGDPAFGDPANSLPPPVGAIGFPSRAADLDALPGFRQPPRGYGEVAFYWWSNPAAGISW